MYQGSSLPVHIQPAHLRPLAYRTLSKKYGLSIKSDGLAALAKFIGDNFSIDWKKNPDTLKFLEMFATVWKQQERGLFVDGQGVQQVIAEIQERKKSLSQNTAAPRKQKQSSAGIDKFLSKKTTTASQDQVLESEQPTEPNSPSSSRQGSQTPAGIPDDSQDESMIANTSMVMPDSSQQNIPAIGSDDDVIMHDEPLPLQNSGVSDTELEDAYETSGTSENNGDELNWRDYFKTINATELQKFSYDPLKMHFVFTPSMRVNNTSTLTIKLPTVRANTNMFSNRYHLVQDRIMRNEAFQNADTYNPLSSMMSLKNELTPGFDSQGSGSYMQITPVKNLLGRDGHNFLIMGLLRRNNKGVWTIEDPSGMTEIDISQAIPTEGLYYVPGCMVLAEGIYFTVGNRFHVTSMTQPPGERREATLENIGNIDLLGINGQSNPNFTSRLDRELKLRLHQMERNLTHHRCVILGGDIFLDQLATMDALRKVFAELDQDPPTTIILNGSFSSVPVYSSMSSRMISATTQYKNNFDSLAQLLVEFSELTEQSTFVFIPGVNDPWSSTSSLGSADLLPQRPIPKHFTQRIDRVCKNVVWGSNPVRIAYLSQEIIAMRDDLDDRFKRHSVIFPMVEEQRDENVSELNNRLEDVSLNDSTIISQLIKDTHQLSTEVEQSRKYVKTLLDQGHLSPFLTTIRPIVWDLDHALTLHPIPTTLIICDTTAPRFDVTYNGCKAMNPGKFILNRRARYLEYIPSIKRAEQQEVHF